MSPKLPPDVPLQLGRLAISVSSLEVLLHMAFASFLADDGTKTEAILSRIDSIQYKIDVVLALAKQAEPNNELAKAILSQQERINAAIKFRNVIAHSQFAVDDEGNISILKNLFRTKSPPKDEPFTSEQAKDHADALQSAILLIKLALPQSQFHLLRIRHGGSGARKETDQL